MTWKTLSCPNHSCRYDGGPVQHGLLVNNGTSHGQKQALCRACGGSVTIRYGTA